MPPDLREAWQDLLGRRSTLAPSLTLYGEVIDHWAETAVAAAPLDWTAPQCRSRWEAGVPLLAEARPRLDPDSLEPLLSRMMELAAGVRDEAGEGLGRFAEAWDRGELGPEAFFPRRGRIGAVPDALGLDEDVVAFLAATTLRPVLEGYFVRCREHLGDHPWPLGVCPFCGAPPAFSDVSEDGRRRLACHLCGSSWASSRLRCLYCGNEETRELARLDFEASADQGYFLSTCRKCRGYLKELDRRTRWNGGPALVEDWGSPHFDLVAERQGFWRPLPPLILGRRAPSR